MPAERVVICLMLNGADGNLTEHFYQRETEFSSGRNDKPVVKHLWVADRSQAAVFSEPIALAFAQRLREEGSKPWIFDLKTGRKIELPWRTETTVAFGDDRQPVMATIDENDEANPNARWFRVIPVNRPDGMRWCLKCTPAGFAEPQLMFAMDPLGCLQRAQSLPGVDGKTLLDFGERVEAPAPKPQQLPNSQEPRARRRPGDLK